MNSSKPTILYLNTEPDSHIHAMTLAGMRRYAAHCGWSVKPIPRQDAGPEALAALLAAHHHVIGWVVESHNGSCIHDPTLFGNAPVVFLHPPPELRAGRTVCVTTDNAGVARMAFRELSADRPAAFAAAGIAFGYPWSDERVRVFRSLCKASRTPCLVFDPTGGDSRTRPRRLRDWVATLPRHSAVFAVSDFVAIEIAAAARTTGRSIPRDLTLIGVDNDEKFCEASRPGLSSILLDHERAGFLAARLLAAEMTKKRTNAPSAVIGPLLVVRRESTRGRGRREKFVLDAVETIRREACNGLSVANLAGRFRCSRRLFDLRFREAMGHSALDEILQTRFERVFALLSRPDVSIGSIADFSGFGCQYELRKLFRLRYGCSLSQWRRDNT